MKKIPIFLKNNLVTPFVFATLFVGIALLIIAVDQTFINNSGGRALTGILAFMGLIIVAIIFFVERFVIVRIKNNFSRIWSIEIILLIIIGIFVYKNVLLL